MAEDVGIGELARRSGVTGSAIRYYDGLGLLAGVTRCGGRRRFGPAAQRRLSLIQLLKSGGFRLREIRALVSGAGGSEQVRREILSSRLEEVRSSISELLRVEAALREAVQCDCASLEDCERIPDLCERQSPVAARGGAGA